MKKQEFEKLKLKDGQMLKINYRSNWRGGDGRPHQHHGGKDIVGIFEMIWHEGIKLRNKEFPINYKAIKSIKILLEGVGSRE